MTENQAINRNKYLTRQDAQEFIDAGDGIRVQHQRPALDRCVAFLQKLQARCDAAADLFAERDSLRLAAFFQLSHDEIENFLATLPQASMDSVFFGDVPAGSV